MNSIRNSTLTLAFAVLSAAGATADSLNPGSLLLFPEFDHSQGHDTLVTVTNTNLDGNLGTVRVHYKYVSGDPGNGLCTIADRTEILTPGDTLTVLTSAHSPGGFERGYLYTYAVDEQGRAVSFNYLVGDLVQVGAANAFHYAINPVPFNAVGGQGNLTDLDVDGIRDLNGEEYERAPNRILIPRFKGQTQQQPAYASELVLLALTGGSEFTTLIDFLLFNDNEEAFSGQHSFRCWEKVPLLTLSMAFGNDFLHDFTNDAANEIIGIPGQGQEAGWLVLDGNTASSSATSIHDPAFLAVLVEAAGPAGHMGAEVPFYDGRQSNGDLLPVAVLGDNN